MRVKSEIDWWLKITIWGTIAIMLWSIELTPENERAISYAIEMPLVAILIWIYFGTYYELQENLLYCKSGPFFERIPYEKIKSIKLSRNLLSSMALSTKRIEIRQHGKGYIRGTTFISPINREEFLQELVKKCPNLEKKIN